MSRRALLSVSDKSGLLPLGEGLAALGFELVASGGTARALKSGGLEVLDVADVTGAPELLGGRVKTLHPRVHGAILARPTDEHTAELARHDITSIEVVVCNLYPFSKTISSGDVDDLTAIEQIDIGGVTLLRAAAKNLERVAVLCDPSQYDDALSALREDTLDLSKRRALALAAFRHTATYDVTIANWIARGEGESLPGAMLLSAGHSEPLRYGENPHQAAAWYHLDGVQQPFTLLQGKALSYNNLIDLDAAWQMPAEVNAPCVAIVKHTNPCGMAVGEDPVQAFERALACDPVSAFGSIIAVNREVDERFVETVGKLFVEVLVAPRFTEGALAWLKQKKKNCRVITATRSADVSKLTVKSVAGGLMVQQQDRSTTPAQQWQVVTSRQPSAQERVDLELAWRVVKHVKSNAIVLVAGGGTVGVGAGQTSRVGAVEIACRLAGDKAKSSVLASDAFFPFPDGVEAAAAAGVTAVIQPGGSKRDPEVIAAAERLGITMVMTGARHFRH